MKLGPVARRFMELVGWGLVAGAGFVMLSQALGWNGTRLVATLQSLTPWSVPPLALVAGVAMWQQWKHLALVAAVVGLSVLGMSIPLVFPGTQPPPLADAEGLRVAAVNLLFSNPEVDAVADALEDRNLDVIVFSEFTEEHHDTLTAHRLADDFPYQINRNGLYAGGMAMWSRFPLEENPRLASINRTIDATITGPDVDVRLLGVHPPTPIFDFGGWIRDTKQIGDAVDDIDEPLVVIGDFNAAYWHPLFRDLLSHDLTDAHIANNSGWSMSWPIGDTLPAFVRLDHALTGNGLVSSDVRDFRVPGSDHSGFDVIVKPTADAAG